jgi:hypothetical protein
MGLSLIYLSLGTDMLTTDTLSRALLGIVGLFALISAITSYCPIYHFAGLSTYKEQQ